MYHQFELWNKNQTKLYLKIVDWYVYLHTYMYVKLSMWKGVSVFCIRKPNEIHKDSVYRILKEIFEFWTIRGWGTISDLKAFSQPLGGGVHCTTFHTREHSTVKVTFPYRKYTEEFLQLFILGYIVKVIFSYRKRTGKFLQLFEFLQLPPPRSHGRFSNEYHAER